MKKFGQWDQRAEALLAQLKANEPAAQRIFWDEHWNVVYMVCASILGDGLPANEVAVEVLSEFLSKYVHGLTHHRAVRTYLRLMAARRSAKERGRLSESVSTNMDFFLDEAGVGTEEAACYSLLLPRLEECLAGLTPKAQKVLKLRYQGGITNEEIGNLLGGSKQYIGRLINQCLGTLRKCLEKNRAGKLGRRRLEGGMRP